jgi:ABC-type nitrate/sulfonate/bicarbonate transport system substrate-binding protein
MPLSLTRRAALLLPLPVLVRPAAAQAPLRLNVFPAASNWPVWAAAEQGLFARRGIAVAIQGTPNSAQQFAGLIDGRVDIASTAMDNVVAYAEGQGEAPGSAGVPQDIVSVAGINDGFLRLVTLPEVRSFADLRGRELSVDALTTGFAFVLRKALERGGLAPGEATLVRVGGTAERFAALMERRQAGTLLSLPLDAVAAQRGFTVLANPSELLGAYQGLTFAVRRAWGAENRARLVAFLRGYLDGLDWLYDTANREAALALLVRNMPTVSAEVAGLSYAAMVTARGGFPRRAELDLAGIRTVLSLRATYGPGGRELADPARYIDTTYLREAQGG